MCVCVCVCACGTFDNFLKSAHCCQLTFHVDLAKPSNVCLLLCPVDLYLEHPLTVLDSLIPDLHQEPEIRPSPHPLSLRGPRDVEETVHVELRGGEEVIGEEFEALDTETEQVCVRERHYEPREVVRYGWVGRRGCV